MLYKLSPTCPQRSSLKGDNNTIFAIKLPGKSLAGKCPNFIVDNLVKPCLFIIGSDDIKISISIDIYRYL